MRDNFREIVSGWTLISGMEDITERIEMAAKWAEANGPLEQDEEATIKLMIESQIARGVARGDFHPHFSVSGRRMIGDPIFIVCESCGGEGRQFRSCWVYERGCGFPHRDAEDAGPCGACDGTGTEEIEGEPIEMEDLAHEDSDH